MMKGKSEYRTANKGRSSDFNYGLLLASYLAVAMALQPFITLKNNYKTWTTTVLHPAT
jgi:hypothetical protein